MGFETIILDADDPGTSVRWTHLQQKCAHSSAFSNFEFASRLARAQDLARSAVFVTDQGNDVAALLATSRRVGPFSEIVPPRFSPVSAFLIDAAHSRAHLRSVAETLAESLPRRHNRVTLQLDSSLQEALELATTSWRHTTLKTYVFNLPSLQDDLTGSWSAGTRRLYRKSIADYDVTSPDNGYDAAVDLCEQSYERSGRPFGIDPAVLKSLAADLPTPFLSVPFVATRRATGQMEGALLVLIHGTDAFYWIAGSLPGPAMTVIIGSAIEHLRDAGIRTFDLLGANSPGIAEFKRRFGPQLVQYLRLTLDRSRILSLLVGFRTRLRAGA